MCENGKQSVRTSDVRTRREILSTVIGDFADCAMDLFASLCTDAYSTDVGQQGLREVACFLSFHYAQDPCIFKDIL